MQIVQPRRVWIRAIRVDGAADLVRIGGVMLEELGEERVSCRLAQFLVRGHRFGGNPSSGHLAPLGQQRITERDQVVGPASGRDRGRLAHRLPDTLQEPAGLIVHLGLFFFSARAHSLRICARPSM